MSPTIKPQSMSTSSNNGRWLNNESRCLRFSVCSNKTSLLIDHGRWSNSESRCLTFSVCSNKASLLIDISSKDGRVGGQDKRFIHVASCCNKWGGYWFSSQSWILQQGPPNKDYFFNQVSISIRSHSCLEQEF
jgi:hypothetical protein